MKCDVGCNSEATETIIMYGHEYHLCEKCAELYKEGVGKVIK